MHLEKYGRPIFCVLTCSLFQLDEIVKQETIFLPSFTADDAWNVGSHLRSRLRELSEKPAVVNIALANRNNLLFHAVSRTGIAPDNDLWVMRKRRTVLRWGLSSWWQHNKFQGDEKAFAAKFMLGESAGDYAIHGGGVPVRVKGVEGVVAVVVVSGLAQHEVSDTCGLSTCRNIADYQPGSSDCV